MSRSDLSFLSLLAVGICTAILALPASAWPQPSSAGQWTWVGGSNTVSGPAGVWPGVYGTKGAPAPGNIPPTRENEMTWTGGDGRFWLFGGETFTTTLNRFFNDLWKFDPDTNEWTWMAGDSTVGSNCPVFSTTPYCGQPGVYGTLGTPAAANSPGGREFAQTWTDTNGHLWLYGGMGFDEAGNYVSLDDLWEFDSSTSEWTWMGGESTVPLDTTCTSCITGIPPVPGSLGAPAAGNTPGSLSWGTTWTDHNGDFWLFSGWGYAPSGAAALPNDLWEYSPSSGEWAWMGGSADFGDNGAIAGTYGTLGVPAPGNFPGTRLEDATWVDANGDLWLFGGEGADSTGARQNGYLNDLWKYNPNTEEWTWMGGSSILDCSDSKTYCYEPGIYGTLGQPSPANRPGSRIEAASWQDNTGDLWLFGGVGFDSTTTWLVGLNDLWEYDPTMNEWTWMGGSSNDSVGSIAGVYGALEVPSATNIPGARSSAASWTDRYGDFWLWGGYGADSAGVPGYENDLWKYQPASAVVSGTVGTPEFSPASGTYSNTQSITITDSTTGATIYYTTDGTIPTVDSTQYTNPIIVAATETVQAIATAPTLIQSALASATYTIPADFTLAINPASLTVQSGGSATATITLQNEGGFNSAVAFACSGLPQGVTCSFTPETVPTPAGVSYTTLTVSAPATSANRSPLIPGSALAAAVCLLGWRKRRRVELLLLVVSIAMLGAFTGCAGANKGTGYSTSTVTVTATSGALSHKTPFTLTVN